MGLSNKGGSSYFVKSSVGEEATRKADCSILGKGGGEEVELVWTALSDPVKTG